MHSFESDYTAGARVEILRRLNETNLEQLPGYGSDKYCESAKEKIRAACDCPGADIFFMVGGTQTNAVVIDSMLPSYGGVIAAQTGHISDHEAGAIEFTGRNTNGKTSVLNAIASPPYSAPRNACCTAAASLWTTNRT